VVGSEHGDHRGGDSAFPSTATFIAHPRSKAALDQQAHAPNRRPGAPPVIVPTETVSDWRTLNLGGREARIGFLGRAHTGGDLVVYLPRERILYTSEVFISGIFPSMANGFPTEWIAALKAAEALDATVFVPAHGLIGVPLGTTKAALIQYREALERVVSEGRRLHDEGIPVAEAPAHAQFGALASLHRYAENLPGAFGRVYLELDHQLPPP
jgi:cyclase